MSVLYISYDGMMEPLGESQVLSYLKCLAKDRNVHLISFEKPSDWSMQVERAALENDIQSYGIVWHPLRYHKWPANISTAWDIFRGTLLGLWLVLTHRLKIVHARSYVSSVMALVIKRFCGVKYVFDMRGFWADEKLESGWSSNGRTYKIAKGFERLFLLEADYTVSLTEAAVSIMQEFPYLQQKNTKFCVIPTCADLAHFKPLVANREDVNLLVGYVGSAGNWYLFDETLKCFALLLDMHSETRFLIVNRGEHEFIRERMVAHRIPPSAVELTSARFRDMPRQLARMDASIFFIKPVFSKQASAPTKLAELLGCGVPCLGNFGVGDMASVLESESVGVAVKAFDRLSLVAGLNSMLQLIKDERTSARCVAAAHKYFSLEDGVSRYRKIYQELDP